MSFTRLFSDPVLTAVVLRAGAVGILISFSCALLGVPLVLKRFSMLGDGLSHIGFCAVAISSLIGLADMSLVVSVPLVIAAAVFLLKLSDSNGIKGDAAIALFSTTAVAVGYLIYSFSGRGAADVCSSLFGSASVITVNGTDLIVSALVSVAVIAFFSFFHNKIFAVSFDEEFCNATGVKGGKYKFWLAVLTGVTVVVGMKMMGAVLISALVVFPAVTAMRICKTFKSVTVSAGIVSVICFVIGYIIACRFSLPIGPTAVAVNAVAFAAAIIAEKTGIIKKKSRR